MNAHEATMSEADRRTDAPSGEHVSESKRTLLKAGWVAPIVVVLSLPAASFDANASGRPPWAPGPPPTVPPFK